MQSARKHGSKFVSRIVKDFQQKELLPLKLLFFVHASTLFVLYPYLTIHMRELGINVEETAIMSAVTPIVAIVMPPLAGMVADKIGNFKVLLSLFSIIGGVASLLLLLVPVGRITVTYPDQVLMSIGCSNVNMSELTHGSLSLTLAEDLPCNTSTLFAGQEAYLLSNMESCGYMCEASPILKDAREVPKEFLAGSSEEENDELSVDSILKARSYIIRATDKISKTTTSHSFNLTQEEVTHRQTKQEALSERFMKINLNFQTAIRRFSHSQYFLPTAGLYELSCSQAEEDPAESSDFLLSSAARFSRMKRENEPAPYNCQFGRVENVSSKEAIANGTTLKSKLEKTNTGAHYKTHFLEWNSNKISPLCEIDNSEDLTATVFLHNPNNNMEVVHEIHLEKCQPSCLLSSKRPDVCSNLKKDMVYNPSLTFWVYLVIRVFIGIIGGTTFAMFEGAVIAVLREKNADYGLQRIYASIGGMISSPLSGILIDWASSGKGYTDFRPAFYLYAALKVVGGILMLLINLEFKTSAENIISDVMSVLKKIEIIALLVACFVLGTVWGYIESFLFWLLQDLGGTRSLMGITITVGGVAGIPLLALSQPIIQKFGHANVIFLGFIFYAIRLLGYSLIYNPWHCLFFEAMESITSSLSFTAAVTYAAKLSTSTTDTSIQGLLGGLYFGVGKGAGSLVGGYLMNGFGTRTTFQIFAVFSCVMGLIYFFFNRFYLAKLPQDSTNEIVKIKPKPDKVAALPVIEEKTKELVKNQCWINNNETEKPAANSKPSSPKLDDNEAHDNPAFSTDEDEKTETEHEKNSSRSPEESGKIDKKD